MMTREEYRIAFDKALEEHSKQMLADKEACKAFLKEMGIWHLLIPIKKRKYYRKRKTSRFATRKK